ncbi:cytochrome P450 [Afipia sp. TerB]
MRNVDPGTSQIPESIGNLIVSPQAYARQRSLLSAFRWLRETNPVGRVEFGDFDPFWAVTRHADILAVSRQHDLFHNGDRATALVPRATDTRIRTLTRGSPHLIRTPVHMDAPDHPAYRAVTHAWFTRQSVHALEGRIRGLARRCIGRMIELDDRCEFVGDVARPFPLQVMLSILGIPEQDASQVLEMTETFFRSQDDCDGALKASVRDPARHAEHLFAVLSGFRAYFKPLIKARIAAPRDDVLTAIAHARIDGQPIRALEAISYLLILATAGHHTTSSSIAGGVWGLCLYPREFEKVRSDLGWVSGLVEEAVRWTTPVQHFMRTATCDTEVGGRAIAKGDWLMLCYLSGSRDESAFEEPDCFRIDRISGGQVAFGHGVHVCLGQHLARLEMRIFFEELLSVIDMIELCDEPKRCASVFVGGPTRVPVRYRLRRQ